MQISQAVRERAGAPEAAEVGAELMGYGIVPGRDAGTQATIRDFSLPCPRGRAQPPAGWRVRLPPSPRNLPPGFPILLGELDPGDLAGLGQGSSQNDAGGRAAE